MSLSQPIVYLQPPKKRQARALPFPIAIGKRYRLAIPQPCSESALHGLIGDYRIGTQTADIVPLQPSASGEATGYFWDTDCDITAIGASVTLSSDGSVQTLADCRLDNNRLRLDRASLDGPELEPVGDGAVLRMAVRFELTCSTDAFAAQLGMLHLVQANRFITLENGEQISLLQSSDDDAPLLYLTDSSQNEPMAWLSAEQPANRIQAYTVSADVAQPLQPHVEGETVASVTVLERYSTYLMQRSIATEHEPAIWTPILAPVSWGWSIRAGRRPDGDWAIMRRKVMLPTTGHDGLQLPLWHNNSLACAVGTGS
ncbi:MAG: hypothetical protein ACU837_14650 [Gammaproteobacteria bacterium]